jgi:hypothetical protein
VNATGDVTVPVAVLLLVTGTLTVAPPRTGCNTDKLRLFGSSNPDATVMAESAPTAVVMFDVAKVNPEGFTLTLMVALL